MAVCPKKAVKWGHGNITLKEELFPDVLIARCTNREHGWIIIQKNKERTIHYYMNGCRIRHQFVHLDDVSGTTRKISLAAAIWIFYLGREIPAGYVIDHIDENPLNNSIGNLQCITRGENSAKAHRLRKKNK